MRRFLYQSCRRLWAAGYFGASRIGERWGWDWLTYNWGVTYSLHNMALRDAPIFVAETLKAFPDVKSIADIGCGSGVYAAEFQSRGLKVIGCEYGSRPLRWAKRLGVNVVPFDLSDKAMKLPKGPFDLALSLEVAEHVPPSLAECFVDFMCETSERIILTAAHPGQGGYGHVNEQPQAYWIEKFEQRGFARATVITELLAHRLRCHDISPFLHQNLMCFSKVKSESVALTIDSTTAV